MRYETPVVRRKLALLLATSWWAAAALPGVAGTPLERRIAPASAEPLAPLPIGGLIAAAGTPATQVAPESAPAEEPVPPPDAGLAALAPGGATPSQNVTINLINRLVERGALTKEDASDLIRLAEADAAEARASADATQAAAERAAAAAMQATAAAEVPPLGDDDMRVTYIPETVRAQMRDEIKHEVLAQAREENWAAPNTLPEWTARIRLFGDVRVRGEGVFFADGNDNTGAFPNFNAINTGSPFDVSGTVFSPQLNVDQDRYRLRLRVRLGLEADLGNGFTAGLRIATGDSSSPVSTNQSLGTSGGNFSKYALWLDRGFLRYDWGGLPTKNLAVMVGRFDNPFFSSEVTWDDDIGFDGIALQGRYEVTPGLTPFATVGAFPVYNTDFNFATNQPAKFKSDDKWLYGAQVGADWKAHKDFNLKMGVAYYYFDGIEGKLSDPFTPLNTQDAGNTDTRRPSFAQKGNTYMALRDIVPNASNNFGATHQYQYFGLATPFRELALTGRLDYNRWEPFQVSVSGEYVKNLAFDRNGIDRIAVNNRGSSGRNGNIGRFAGGDTAWIAGVKVGHPALDKSLNWQVGMNYRHVESDAVVDGFTDSDFGLGGTNLKGYSIFGAVALSPRMILGIRWMSATEIAGPPLRTDIIQFEIGGKF